MPPVLSSCRPSDDRDDPRGIHLMNRVLALSVTLACLIGTAAHALDDDQDDVQDDDFARSGVYVGAYGFYAIEAYRDTGGADFDNTGGANFRIGYRGNRWFALEAEFEWIEKFEGDVAGRVDARTIIGGVNARLYPMTGRYQPYGLIGVNGMHVRVEHKPTGLDVNGTDWGFRFGMGLDIYATRHIVLGLEGTYVWGVGDVWERDYGTIGAGILYRF
jgi:opacity protein-like surface antigen